MKNKDAPADYERIGRDYLTRLIAENEIIELHQRYNDQCQGRYVEDHLPPDFY